MPVLRGSDKGTRPFPGTEHSELAAEMNMLAKLPMPERLKHARKRRTQQLKDYIAFERQFGGESTGKNKNKKSGGTAGGPVGVVKRPESAKEREARKRLRFTDSILLLDAVGRNDINEVKQLLAAGIDPNAANTDSLTALHQCCIDNLEEMARLLVDHGADVNCRDIELWTPLHAAATCGHVGICKYLVEHGAELLSMNADGNMPYDICEEVATLDFIETEMSNRGVTQELIEETRLASEMSMLMDLRARLNDGRDLDYRGPNGETPLHIAACNGYDKAAKFLLDHQAAIDATDNDGWQPVHCATCWGQLSVFQLLLERGVSSEAKTQLGDTPLDVCDDLEIRQRIIEIISEVVARHPAKPREIIHRESSHRGSSRRTSNASPAAHACIRRSSLHERTSALAMSSREAQEEAQRLLEPMLAVDDEDEDDNEGGIELSAITVNPADIPAITGTEATNSTKASISTVTNNTEPLSKVKSCNTDSNFQQTTRSAEMNNKSDGLILAPPLKSGTFPLLTDSQQRAGGDNNNPASATGDDKNVTALPSNGNRYTTKVKTSADSMTQPSHSSSAGNRPNSFSPNVGAGVAGTQSVVSPAGGTLLDLKRQRARRNQGLSLFCLDVKDDDAQDNVAMSTRAGQESGFGASSANGAVAHTGAGDGPRHKFVNTDEVVHGESNGCCVVM